MIRMPEPDQTVLARRAEILEALRQIVPGEGVIDSERERRAFECDELTAYQQLPMVVVLPENTQQVVGVLRYCKANRMKVVPRGTGTSLSGGALPLADGIILGLGKFKRILDIDVVNRGGAARRHQSRHHPCRPGRGALLRARSVESDRLCDWRQCRRRRRALPQIWPHDQ